MDSGPELATRPTGMELLDPRSRPTATPATGVEPSAERCPATNGDVSTASNRRLRAIERSRGSE